MSFVVGIMSFLLLLISLFIILLVLIQRGRGGGLAGAFGGMGGQSAFGTRAGDTFTKVTIVLAVVWVLTAGTLGIMMRGQASANDSGENTEFKSRASEQNETGDADAEVKKALDSPGPDLANPGSPAAPESKPEGTPAPTETTGPAPASESKSGTEQKEAPPAPATPSDEKQSEPSAETETPAPAPEKSSEGTEKSAAPADAPATGSDAPKADNP